MIERLSKTDRVLVWIFIGYQIIGSLVGLYYLTKIIFLPEYRASINSLSIILGYMYFISCFFFSLLIKRKEKIWLGFTFLCLLAQSIYLHKSHFLFNIVNGISWVRIFDFESKRVKADVISISHLDLGVVQKEMHTGWGINFISIFLLLYFVYILFKYFIEKRDIKNESK
jgi:hypothetical protein